VKSDVETISPTRIKLTVEVPFADLGPSLTEAYQRIGSQVSIPGFRKGKVPQRIIDQRVGRGAVLEEAVNEMLPTAYEQAVKESGVVVIGQPEVDITELVDGEKLSFTAEVDVRPEFELPDLGALRVEVSDGIPTEDDVQSQLDSLRIRFATLAEVEREAVDGDVLLVDLSGDCDGAEVEELGAKAISYEVGKDGLIPGFDEAVRGAKAGDARTFAFVPEAGEWAGKDVVVTVQVGAVRERILPEADDDFAAMASEFDTMEELNADIGERLVRVKRLEQGVEARNKVDEALLELVEMPLPENLIEAEVAGHFEDGHGDEEHRGAFVAETRTKMKRSFILDKIADREGLSVNDGELTAWLLQQAPRYGMAADQFANALVEAGQVPSVIAEVRRSKAMASVLSLVTVVGPSGEEVDLEALNEQLQASLGSNFGSIE
jgi:trigger factor